MTLVEWVILVAGGIVTVSAAVAVLIKMFVKAVEAVVGPKFEALEESHREFASTFSGQQQEQDEDFYGEIQYIKGRLDDLTGSVRWLEDEMKPNHGTSMRDAVDRLEQMMLDHINGS